MRNGAARALGVGLLALAGCSSTPLESGDEGGDSPSVAGSLMATVEPGARTFIELAGPSRLALPGDGSDSIAWDLALQGREVFTNSGVSGPGNGGAFGPLSAPTFLSDTAPDAPILFKDRAGGALIDWYRYVADSHQLFSRYHVYGLREGARLFKLQVLGYYSQQPGNPASASYTIRYAEVTKSDSGEVREIFDIDASAGGNEDDDSEPSACVDLDSQRVSRLTPAQAAQSDAWQLCFRREAVAVNGGLSGPRGIEAVDLQAAETAEESPEQILARTAESELPLFESVDYSRLVDASLAWREDGVATAFAGRWLDASSEPIQPRRSVWLVIGADGFSKYLLQFEGLAGDPAAESSSLALRVKSVR